MCNAMDPGSRFLVVESDIRALTVARQGSVTELRPHVCRLGRDETARNDQNLATSPTACLSRHSTACVTLSISRPAAACRAPYAWSRSSASLSSAWSRHVPVRQSCSAANDTRNAPRMRWRDDVDEQHQELVDEPRWRRGGAPPSGECLMSMDFAEVRTATTQTCARRRRALTKIEIHANSSILLLCWSNGERWRWDRWTLTPAARRATVSLFQAGLPV